MAARFHRPLKVVAFNTSGIGRQRYELSKQLPELHIDVALLPETNLKTHERLFILNYHIYRRDRFPGRKGRTAVEVKKKGISLNNADLPPLVPEEASGVCIPIGNSEILLAVVCKSLGRAWIDEDITELLSFRHKSLLAGDLNAKHPFWNSTGPTPSGEKLLHLFDVNEIKISALQCSTHSPAVSGDVLDNVFHQNIRLPGVTVSDILESDHLPIVFTHWITLQIRTFRNLLKHSETGNGFKVLPLT
jgi:hypothetical protein